jgi:hypothetical protein
MFEPKRTSREKLVVYIGARVTEPEEVWLRAELRRRKLTMSDFIRLAISKIKGGSSEGKSK